MRLYKFYSARWGRDALQKNRLKITTSADINDPFELTAAALSEKNSRRLFKGWRDDMLSRVGLISFCERWSNPVIWSHYAESHKGICLGFDVSEPHLIKVEYVEDRLEVAGFLNNGALRPEDQLGARLLRTKFAHWAYEDEQRMFFDFCDPEIIRDDGRYFYPFGHEFTLREVILGALYEPQKEEPASIPDLKGIKVTTARIAFRKFEVVEQFSGSLAKQIWVDRSGD